jgi:hypothetical protein
MFGWFSAGKMVSRLLRCLGIAAVIACLGLSGCCGNFNSLRGENFRDDELASQGRRLRTPDRRNELFGVTNKAQQIERDVGIQ